MPCPTAPVVQDERPEEIRGELLQLRAAGERTNEVGEGLVLDLLYRHPADFRGWGKPPRCPKLLE